MIAWLKNIVNNFRQKRKIYCINSEVSSTAKLYSPNTLVNVSLGDYSYISAGGVISETEIGKFCSIGPNLMCGWGIHPSQGVSTAPMFYSTRKQNGYSLVEKNLVEERKQVRIGHDVFIGMNVSILDGVSIGNGAIIGAGAVVSKDIPAYGIAVGNPIKVVKFRFSEEEISALQATEWWNFNDDKLQLVAKHFNDIPAFLSACEQNV